MPRNITVTFDDGSTHVYNNAPDDITPDQVTARAQQDFQKQVKAIDGGRKSQQISAQIDIEKEFPYPEMPKSVRNYGRGGSAYNQDKTLYNERVRQVDALRSMAKTDPGAALTLRDMSSSERLAAGFGAGVSDLARGAGIESLPSFGGMVPISKEPEREADLLAETATGGGGRIMGQAAPFIPASLAGGGLALPARLAYQAGVGATEGGLIASGTGKDPVTGALVGAAFGGGAEALGSVINRIGGALIQKHLGRSARAVDESGNPTTELQKAMDAEGVSFDQIVNDADSVLAKEAGSITPERAARNEERRQAFERFGVQPTEAQRTRDKDLFVTQQDRFRQGGDVSERLEGQEQAFYGAATRAVSETGGSPSSAITSPIAAITNKATRLDNEISDLYRSARESAPDVKNIKFNNASAVLRRYAGDDQLSGGVISSLQKMMENNGALTGFKPTGRVGVEAAENFRKQANQLFPSTNDRGKMILREFKDAIDADTGAGVGKDFFAKARSAKAQFESGLNREKFNKFDEREVNLVRDILNNKVTPDDLQKGALIKAGSVYKAQDLSDLKRYLESGSPEDILAGQQAWNDIRASAMRSIKDKAFVGAEGEAGVKSLSRAGLERAINDIGKLKFDVLFDAKEKQFLYNLSQVARFKEPPPGTFTGSGPSSPAISNAAQKLESRIEQIYGIRIPVASTIKGKMAERQLLKLNDDLAEIERENIKKTLKPYINAIVAPSAIVGVSAAAQE